MNKFSFEKMCQWSIAVRLSVVFIVNFVVVLLGYYLLLKTNVEQLNLLREQETSLKISFATKQHQASKIQAYRKQAHLINERFAAVVKQLPEKNEMPGLLEELSKTGLEAGLQFELFAPQPEVLHDFYIELPIKITVLGSYKQLAYFLSSVAQMKRIVTVHEFSLEQSAAEDSKDILQIHITAKIYRHRSS